MNSFQRRVLLVGQFGQGALESSYASAFRDVGCEVHCFDIVKSIDHNCRLGRPGRLFNEFVPVEPWIRKANREVVLKASEFRPNLVVVFGQNQMRAGALGQIRATLQTSLVYIWPDTMVNLAPSLIAALPLYDLVATYSASTTTWFERLGARQAIWIPLAADPHLHPVGVMSWDFQSDVAFIGQWRPEREEAIAAILGALAGIHLKIWGPDWGRRSRDPRILRAWQKRALYGQEFSKAVGSAKINLNIIDETNYPAANMRFFEIPCAGGLELASSCPEMEDEFRHGETIFYYRSLKELSDLVEHLLVNDILRDRVARTAMREVSSQHTYAHRVQAIMTALGDIDP